LNGKTYTETGDYVDTAQTAATNGCDSIVTLKLTILKASRVDRMETACESFTWDLNGKKYEATGDYVDTVKGGALNGCDSIVTLHLTILQPVRVDRTESACESFVWDLNDKTYNASGDYVDTVKGGAYNGCDSIVTLHLTIKHGVKTSDKQSACKSYDWEGDTYTKSGSYEKTLVAVNGCDSVVTLELIIFSEYEKGDTLVVDTCRAYTWEQNNVTYDEPGLYTDTIESPSGLYCGTVKYLKLSIAETPVASIHMTSCEPVDWHEHSFTPGATVLDTVVSHKTIMENGCDSITKLYLHLAPRIAPTILYDTACVSYVWDVNKKEYTESTVVSETLPSKEGCDSLVTLNLTILQPVVRDTAAEECNLFVWRDYTYINDTIVYDTIVGGASNGCDSIVKLSLKIGRPFVSELDLISKYGDRLLMINRTQINKLLADSLSRYDDTTLVKWYREAEPEDEFLGYGYYYTNDGQPVAPGTYYAVIEIPGTNGVCPAKGETSHYVVVPAKGAPALVPNYALPGQDIRVINLDPEQHTTIRIYTSEGILHGSYTTSGETTFTIKAANDHGFYLVELSDDSMKSTLRYIVK
jgi:hypothetical protein